MKFEFPDEDIMFLKSKDCEEPIPEEGPDPESEWILMFDGAVNVNGSGVGAVLVTPKGSHILFVARLTFECTNHVAEYEVCILGIEPRCVHLLGKRLSRLCTGWKLCYRLRSRFRR